jgi:hypothetical protein
MKYDYRDRGHPSGRPIRRDSEPRTLPIMRDPGEGPFLPRLRRPKAQDAIGFHRIWPREDDE